VNLQVGVSQASTLSSGFLAFPVFLMWSFTSWCTVLIGAEIAVAHHVDDVLVHGARAFSLDLAGEREASLIVLIRLAIRARTASGSALSDDQLARSLRLPPQLVRNLCVRLVDRGLLVEKGQAFELAFDPEQATVGTLVDAIERDPALSAAHRDAPRARGSRALPRSLTLAQLAKAT